MQTENVFNKMFIVSKRYRFEFDLLDIISGFKVCLFNFSHI